MDAKLQELLVKHTAAAAQQQEAPKAPAPVPVAEPTPEAKQPVPVAEAVQAAPVAQPKEIVVENENKLALIKKQIQEAKKKKQEELALIEKENQYKKQIEELQSKASYADKFESLKKDKTQIFSLAREIGLTDEDIVNFAYNERKEEGFATKQEPKLDVEQIQKTIQENIYREFEKKRNETLVNELVFNVKQFIKENQEDLPLLNISPNAHNQVISLMKEYFETNQKVLDFKEACSLIHEEYENDLEKKMEVIKKASKLKKYFRDNNLPEKPIQETEFSEKKQGVVNPLSQKDANSISRNEEVKLTSEEKFKMLMEKHLKKQ